MFFDDERVQSRESGDVFFIFPHIPHEDDENALSDQCQETCKKNRHIFCVEIACRFFEDFERFLGISDHDRIDEVEYFCSRVYFGEIRYDRVGNRVFFFEDTEMIHGVHDRMSKKGVFLSFFAEFFSIRIICEDFFYVFFGEGRVFFPVGAFPGKHPLAFCCIFFEPFQHFCFARIDVCEDEEIVFGERGFDFLEKWRYDVGFFPASFFFGSRFS